MRTVGSRSPQFGNESNFSSVSGSSLHLVNSNTSPDLHENASKPKPNKVYWPRDLLPLEIPEAKILTYGYDADVIGAMSGGYVKMNNFTTHGQDLLVKLQREILDQVSRSYSTIYTDSHVCH
jgi:hypothetical protein